MLNIWERRKRHPKTQCYQHTLLEVAMGAPEILLPHLVASQHSAFGRTVAQRTRRKDTSWLAP